MFDTGHGIGTEYVWITSTGVQIWDRAFGERTTGCQEKILHTETQGTTAKVSFITKEDVGYKSIARTFFLLVIVLLHCDPIHSY